MKTVLSAVLGSAAVVVAATSLSLPDSEAAATLTGCLRQGSANTVRLLRQASGGEEGPPRDYLLVAVADPAGLEGLINRQVRIDGDVFASGQGPEPPAGANAVERALRRLSVRSATQVAESCEGR